MEFTFSPHIAIKVKDYERACAFYKDTLGFELIEIKKNETHFKKNDINFYIENDANAEATFFEFKVESVPEAIQLLEDQSCTVTDRFSDKSIMVKDPFGMRFHVWEEGADLT